ncbi:MAG: cytochrome c3 family protein [Planctomycetota bacterium]
MLLDEPGEGETEKSSAAATAGAVAENDACFVCHANYREEPLVGWHAEANIGCVACHGKSYAHRNDENNTTPPDIMYPVDKIDRSCRKCHATHDVPAEKVVVVWLQRYPNKTHPKTIICTDCHGDHRLELRSVRWDKRTGKLRRGNKGQ